MTTAQEVVFMRERLSDVAPYEFACEQFSASPEISSAALFETNEMWHSASARRSLRGQCSPRLEAEDFSRGVPTRSH